MSFKWMAYCIVSRKYLTNLNEDGSVTHEFKYRIEPPT